METENNTLSFKNDLFSFKPNQCHNVNLCFVCCSILENSEEKHYKTNQLLSHNLNVFFLLKNLLQIPDNMLINYLKEFGNPTDWMIILCESCNKLATKATEFHNEMIKCQQELVSIQMLIIDQINLSAVNKKENLELEASHFSTWKKTREFIKKYDYKLNINNPFVDGDKLAKQLVERLDKSLHLSDEHVNWESKPNSPEINAEFNGETDNSSVHSELDQDEDCEVEHVIKTKREIKIGKNSQKITRKAVEARTLRDWSKYKKVNGKIKCKYCEKVFSRQKGVRIHEDEFHCNKKGQFICDICGKPWNTYTRLRVHKRDAHNLRPDGSSIEKNLNCEITKRSQSSGKIKLETELEYNLDDNKDNGDVERKPLRDWSKYEKVDGKIKCSYCEKVFSRRKAVRIHENEFHCSNPGQFVCDICGSPWNTYARLRQHRRDVHFLRPDGSSIEKVFDHTCHLCGKGFPTPSKLKRHMTKHKS